MQFWVPIFMDGFMTKILIETNDCHEIAYKHFYTSRICILNGISLSTQSTYFPHKNPEMAINIAIYIWHLRAFDGIFTVKRKGEQKDSGSIQVDQGKPSRQASAKTSRDGVHLSFSSLRRNLSFY